MSCKQQRRILYFQHTAALGGSCYSLLYLIQGLDRSRYQPVVCCLQESPVAALYRECGIETHIGTGIHVFEHTTGGWHRFYDPLGWRHLIQQLVAFWPSVRYTEAIVKKLEPDLVHLNSLVLAPSAIGVKRIGVPLVWHIRESVVDGHLGLRKKLLGQIVEHLPDEAIFISHDGRRLLVGDRTGVVIPNFVNLERFDRNLDGISVRDELALPPGVKVILFLGGISRIKGIFPLLEALHMAKEQVPELHCLLAGAQYQQSSALPVRAARAFLPLIGQGTHSQRVYTMLRQYRMESYVRLLPFRRDVERLIAASDLVVFPSVEPHFARPIIEAGAMAKPVVASRIGGVEELVVDGETGRLVSPNDPQALAEALVSMLASLDDAHRMGENGYSRAHQLFNAETNVRATIDVYERILGKRI